MHCAHLLSDTTQFHLGQISNLREHQGGLLITCFVSVVCYLFLCIFILIVGDQGDG